MTNRIALVARRDLFSVPGGDTLQIAETARELTLRGYAVDVVTGSLRGRADHYDLAHAFNITRVHDTLARCRECAEAGLPIVLSPIHHPLTWVDQYERGGRPGFVGRVGGSLSRDHREAGKAMWHAARQPVQLPDAVAMAVLGYTQAQLEVLSLADAVVCNSHAELDMLRADTGYGGEGHVSYLGLSRALLGEIGRTTGTGSRATSWSQDTPFILCIGRVEPRKGQLDLVRVARDVGCGLVLVGGASRISPGYQRRVLAAGYSLRRFLHIEQATQEELVSWYRTASVHVLPSWFETVGLVTMEAVACGCMAVSTERSYVAEYLGDSCVYARPGNLDSLRQGVLDALARRPQNERSIAKARGFTWEQSVNALLPAYEAILGGHGSRPTRTEPLPKRGHL